jgi:hypothetical protein
MDEEVRGGDTSANSDQYAAPSAVPWLRLALWFGAAAVFTSPIWLSKLLERRHRRSAVTQGNRHQQMSPLPLGTTTSVDRETDVGRAITCTYERVGPLSRRTLLVWLPWSAQNVDRYWGYAEMPTNPGELGAEWRDYDGQGSFNEWVTFWDSLPFRPDDQYPVPGRAYMIRFDNGSHNRWRALRHIAFYTPKSGQRAMAGDLRGFYGTKDAESLKVLLPATVRNVQRSFYINHNPPSSAWHDWTSDPRVSFSDPVPEKTWPQERADWLLWEAQIPKGIGGQCLFVLSYDP